MYRIFCESYQNFIQMFDKEDTRLKLAEPFGLIVDIQKYKEQEKEQSDLYKKLCDLIWFLTENIERFPKVKAFLWTLSSRNIKLKNYNISKKEDLEEQAKLINSFLKLAYWY